MISAVQKAVFICITVNASITMTLTPCGQMREAASLLCDTGHCLKEPSSSVPDRVFERYHTLGCVWKITFLVIQTNPQLSTSRQVQHLRPGGAHTKKQLRCGVRSRKPSCTDRRCAQCTERPICRLATQPGALRPPLTRGRV